MPRQTLKPKDPEQYHHGDLSRTLLLSAERLINRDGLEAFTLRACAREAGVSHAAPAHHFGDLRGLLSALAVVAFGRMGNLMDAYSAKAHLDGEPPMAALGLAYIDFALRHPGLYRLMFRIEVLDPDDQELTEAVNACHQRMADAVRAVATDPANAGEIEAKSALAWSVVHGYASLAMEGHFGGIDAGAKNLGDRLIFAARMLEQLKPLFG